jgi:hypothetical protein
MPSVRSYCRKLKLKLPLNFAPKEKWKRKKRRRQWAAKPIAELNGCHLKPESRLARKEIHKAWLLFRFAIQRLPTMTAEIPDGWLQLRYDHLESTQL